MEGKFEVGRYEENRTTYLGAKIKNVGDSTFDGLVLDSDDYEDKINHTEMPHGRTRHRNGALTGEEKAISRSKLGKSMWVARIARPVAIYDASAAAQTSTEGEIIEESGESEEISEIEKKI